MRKRFKIILFFFYAGFAAALISLLATSAAAENPVEEMSATAEAIRKQERIKPEKPKKPTIIEEEPLPSPTSVEGEKKFFIKKIIIEGNTVLKTEDLEKIVKPLEDKEVTFTQLQTAATAITNFYRAQGYVTCAAYFPPQKIDARQITIRIMEGKIDGIIVEGNRFFRKKFIRDGYNAKEGDIFNYNLLEKDLTKINLHPDREVKAVLIPGRKPETSDVILKVKDKFPVHVGYSFDNLGTRLSGTYRNGISLRDTNLLSLDDIALGKFLVSEFNGLLGVVTDYQLPLHNKFGTKLGFGFSWIRTVLGKELKYAKITGHSMTFTPSVTQPLFESRYVDCDFRTGFNFKDSNTKYFGTNISYDNIRSWSLGPTFTIRDPYGTTYFGNNLNFGFGEFLGGSGANDNTSRPGTGNKFFHTEMSATRYHPFIYDTLLIYKGFVQIAPNNLLPAEQLRLGGADTIRGYPEGDFLGDYGFMQTVEVRIPPYFIPKDYKLPLPFTNQTVWDGLQLVYFIDVGKGFLYKSNYGGRSTMMMAGTGWGLRMTITNFLNSRVDCAWPVSETPTNGSRRMRFHVSLNLEY